jgi:hypothetical protein
MPAHADRIHTAILENTSDTEFLIYLPLYRSLVDLGKPVELYVYPEELHVRNQPRHRLEVYERNLDWFRFWLKGEESSDPNKDEQYQRWKRCVLGALCRRTETVLQSSRRRSFNFLVRELSEPLSDIRFFRE